MTEKSITDALVREFLLGKLADEEHERIEDLFLTDPHARERVLAIEQELIDDYFDDSLNEEDKERFVSLYAQTDEQQRKLRIARSVTDWATAEAKAPQAIAASVSIWSRLRTRFRLQPLFVVPIAATIVIAIVLGFLLLNRRLEQQRHLAVEQELAQLNSPGSLREVPPHVTSYDLRPVSPRSVEAERELKAGVDAELRLPWIHPQRYSTYRVDVGRVDENKYSFSSLAEEASGAHVIRIRLPGHMLRRGHYRITVNGMSDDGTPGLTQEFQFAVRD